MSASKQQKQMALWRKNKVMELVSKSHSVTEIASILKVDKSVISRDITYLNLQAKQNLDKFVERLPYEYERCLNGIDQILKLAWVETYHRDIERRELIQMLALAKECYLIKMDLLTNARVLDEAMKFVARRNQSNQNHISSEKVSKTENFADGNGNGKESSSTEDEEVEEEKDDDVVEEEHEDLDDVEVTTTDDRVF
jgi:hypothetical protein